MTLAQVPRPVAVPTLSPEEEEMRDLYAHFGRAYYKTELVYQGLVYAVAMLSFDGDLSRPRVDENLRAASEKTLGQLVPLAKKVLSESLHASLDWALVERNFLAHGFWYARSHMMSTSDGKRALMDELEDAANRMGELNSILTDIMMDHLHKLGMTEETFQVLLAESKTEPTEPFPKRRIPRTGEDLEIVKAWVVRSSESLTALVLEDAAGERWQLCDVGLGWSYLEEDSGDWKPCDQLQLPARVVARPKGAANWSYRLTVSTGKEICVYREPATSRLTWTIRSLGSKPSPPAGSR
jgi:hypothetical protein